MKIQQLGFVAANKRTISPLGKYAALILPSTGTNKILMPDGNTFDTVNYMVDFVKKYSYQVGPLAKQLVKESGGNPNSREFKKRVFDWIYEYVDYVPDKEGVEQIREPGRCAREQKGDCDCMATLANSLLVQGGAKEEPKFKKIALSSDWQHVYAVSGPYVIDPVLNHFNEEAKGITKSYVQGLSGLNGMPIQQLGAVAVTVKKDVAITSTAAPANNQSTGKTFAQTNEAGQIVISVQGTGTGGAVTITPGAGSGVNIQSLLNSDELKAALLAAGKNPFEETIKRAFIGTTLATFAQTTLAPRNKSLNGLSGIEDINPLDAGNLDTVLSSGELQKYSKDVDSALSKMNLADTKKVHSQLNKNYAYLKQNTSSAEVSKIASTPTPIKELANSSVAKGLITGGATTAGVAAAISISGATGLATATTATACVASLVCGAVAAGIAAIVIGCVYIFSDNADTTVNNFIDWLSGKGPSSMLFDNNEGYSVKVDVNIYGELIRNWRALATGSTSGTDTMQNPNDYLPILLSIYQNAPIKPGEQLIVNPNKTVLHAQFDNALRTKFGNEYWRQFFWMKTRAFMVTPLLAEMLYNEPYTDYKANIRTQFANVNWQLIDDEYLRETKDVLKLQLLIAKRDQIALENSKNPNNKAIDVNEPAVSGAILWIGGQYNGTKTGIMTNQNNLALKKGDVVFLQFNAGTATEYTGLHTVDSLGSDDGQYPTSMFVVNTPKTTSVNGSGVFQLQEVVPANTDVKTASVGGWIGALLLLAGIGAVVGRNSNKQEHEKA
ncbi:MAG: hypothetical protein V4538_01740 [Bacteroidota bacterium]